MKKLLYLLPVLALTAASALLGACSKKSSDTPTPSGNGDYMNFTYDGKDYHAALYTGAIEDSDTSLVLTGSSDDKNTVVLVRLSGIWKRKAAVYQFLDQAHMPDDINTVASLTLDGSTPANGKQYSTQKGPATLNGTATVTAYDRAKQQVSGTFSFTAGALYGTPAGNKTVTNGKFSFTAFH